MGAGAQYAAENQDELLQRARKGDREAFYNLVQPFERRVYAVAMAILSNPSDAEEVAQEAVLKALANLHGFRGDARFSTWLIQITVNEARLRLRKDRRRLYDSIDEGQKSEEGDYRPKDFADWREIPSDALKRKELREALKRAIASLPVRYREVLILRDVENLNIEETATTLGISESNVKTRLHRARLQLRDFLAPGIDGSWSNGSSEYKKVRPW